MSPLPVPARLRQHLALTGAANKALLFDRGLGTYEPPGWTLGGPEKKAFLEEFAGGFNGDLSEFWLRRSAVFKVLGASEMVLTTAARLVIGLGLPHSVETGFLFDRLTGCPYLPGSSVKGLLRDAAKGIGEGRFPGDTAFWTGESVRRVFGPETGDAEGPAQGRLAFYDAFPLEWPKLEVDVLTPHYSAYYSAKGTPPPPGDWEGPKPVAFLTIKAGTHFRFFVRGLERSERGSGDVNAVLKLLPLAVEWLGIGGKKSAGYGYFEGKHEAAVTQPGAPVVADAGSGPTKWTDVLLSWEKNTGTLKAAKGRERAETCDRIVLGKISAAAIEMMKKGKKDVYGDVMVEPLGGNNYRIVNVELRGEPGGVVGKS